MTGSRLADLLRAGTAVLAEQEAAADPALAEFRRRGRDGVLRFQRCASCGYLRYPPAERCPECLTAGDDWVDDAGFATVWSVAVYHRAYSPHFAVLVPYAVVLAELDSGLRLITTVVGLASADVRIGLRGVVRPEPVGQDSSLAYFHPTRERRTSEENGP